MSHNHHYTTLEWDCMHHRVSQCDFPAEYDLSSNKMKGQLRMFVFCGTFFLDLEVKPQWKRQVVSDLIPTSHSVSMKRSQPLLRNDFVSYRELCWRMHTQKHTPSHSMCCKKKKITVSWLSAYFKKPSASSWKRLCNVKQLKNNDTKSNFVRYELYFYSRKFLEN